MAFEAFDILVIGSGTAGKIVANACVEAGLKTAIADNREYGGTCTNRGCDPKKVLVGLTEIMARSKQMLGKGIDKMPKTNWKELMKYKKTFVDAVPATTEKKLQKAGITLYHQSPTFLDKNTLSVEGKTITAKNIVIATGKVPVELKIPGRNHALISDDFLNLTSLPKHIVFIGAGYIGMEFAHIAARFGVKVTVLDLAPRPLTNFEECMVTPLREFSEKELGITFIFEAKVTEIEKLQKNYRVKALQNGKSISVKAEMVFNTAGRVPAISDLNLKKGDISFTKRGVKVNKKLQNLTNPNVYACGDVADSAGLPLTPLSSYEAQKVVAQLLSKEKKQEITYPPQPSVVFTLPNIASVGLSEKEAKEKEYAINIKEEIATKWYNAKRINTSIYAYKIIIDQKTDLILGAHLIGPETAEVINLFTMAIYGKLTRNNLKNLLFAYPTWGNDIKSML